MITYPPPFIQKIQNIVNRPGYAGAAVKFLSDYEHLQGGGAG